MFMSARSPKNRFLATATPAASVHALKPINSARNLDKDAPLIPNPSASAFSTSEPFRTLNKRKLRQFVRPYINLKKEMRVSQTDQYVRTRYSIYSVWSSLSSECVIAWQINRHIGNDAKETQDILDYLQLSSVDELIDQTVPDTIRSNSDTAFEYRGKTVVGLNSES